MRRVRHLADLTGRAGGSHGIGFDRRIAADRPVRGVVAVPDAHGVAPDWIVRWKPPVAAPRVAPPIWSPVPRGLCFRPAGVADYRCTPGAIDVTPVAGADRTMVEDLLIATAMPALAWLEGAFVLHAAAVVPPGAAGALAIAGASGSGKSRLAAGLLARGAHLVADDSIALRWTGSANDAVPHCSGLAGGYHLSPPGAAARHFHVVPVGRTRRVARLSAVIVLSNAPGIARLDATEAAGTLLAGRHRASVPRRCGMEPRALGDAVRLALAVPVFRWFRGDSDALLDDMVRGRIMQVEGMR